MTRGLRIAAVALSGVGVVVSAYLTWVHYSGVLALCVGFGGCEAVQSTRFATVSGLPVAAIGLAGFTVLLALSAARLRPDAPAWSATAVFGLALGGTMYAAYLTYLELFVIGAVCPWCVTVATAVAGILAVTVLELRGSAPFDA